MRKVVTLQPAAAVSQVWMSHTLSEALKTLAADERAALLAGEQPGRGVRTGRLLNAQGRIKLLRYFDTP